MVREYLPTFIFYAGIGQLGVLLAAALVPSHLDWKRAFASLSRLHRQMYWTYGAYIVLAIVALGTLSIVCAEELASGTLLSRGIALYMTAFWGGRLALQGVFDVKPYLTRWWLAAGYHLLTVLFLYFTVVFGYAAFGS